jgi:hypothetical protein
MKFIRLSRGSETKGRHWISITKIIRAKDDDENWQRSDDDDITADKPVRCIQLDGKFFF